MPTSTPLVPQPLIPGIDVVPPEVILFVGAPCSGKTFFYRRWFQPRGFIRLVRRRAVPRPSPSLTTSRPQTDPEDTDTLQHYLKAGKNPKSIVIDALMPSAATRRSLAHVVHDFSQHRVRLFHFVGQEHLCKHNSVFFNLYGDQTEGKRQRFVTEDDFRDFYSRWEKPTLDEGYDEMKRINFQICIKDPGGEELYKAWSSKYLDCYPRDTSGKNHN